MTDPTPSDPATVAYTGPKRVVSGVQPSGALHLGNYLGAIVTFTRVQHEVETLLFVADMHALTATRGPGQLAAQTREVVAAYIACGVDPAVATIFVQSAMPAHAELAWIFNCTARLGWLDRMTQFKEKSGKHKERASIGLYTYPVLQAADILAYKATHVPVGDDQRQHLELTRDIAQKFNFDFNAPGFFPLTEPLIQGAVSRVMSLRDGTAKMSKSDPVERSRINLLDEADAIAEKIRGAKTDSAPVPDSPETFTGRPEAENLIGIYAALAGVSREQVFEEFGGKGFAAFKPALAEVMVGKVAPIGARMRELMADPATLDGILARGAEKARVIAEPVVAEAKRLVGFWEPGRA